MTDKIRVLIVDDEPLSRERIRGLLKGEVDIDIIGECGDGRAAVAAVRNQTPDLMFLDVQMPKLDGFGVLREIAPDNAPVTIFTTAFDQYALKAFEVHAFDYLMKPFDRDRFQDALQRARQQLQQRKNGDLSEKLAAILEEAQPPKKPLDRLVIKSGGRVQFLRLEDIDWIEAAGNYLRLHAGDQMHLLRETMNALEARLDAQRFIRIHRSTMVNIERVQELQPWFHGDYVVLLRNGKQLTMSRSYRQKLQSVFGAAL